MGGEKEGYGEAARLEFVAISSQAFCVNCVLLDDVVVEFCECVCVLKVCRVSSRLAGHARMKYSEYPKAILGLAAPRDSRCTPAARAPHCHNRACVVHQNIWGERGARAAGRLRWELCSSWRG